jgi:hypothetical protein
MSEQAGIFQKDPSETADYYIDWTDALAGDTITGTPTWSTQGGLTQEPSPAPGTTGATTYVWLSGGISGVDYTVECTIETTGGRTFQAHILIQVR